jgi:hypothetical protein
MTLNSVYLGRVPAQTNMLDCKEMPQRLFRDGMQSDTAYVLSDAYTAIAASLPHLSHYCRRVDGFNLCTHDPVRAHESQQLIDSILPYYELGTQLRSEDPTPKSLLLENFDDAPGWGKWTSGRTAAIYLRFRQPVPHDMRLEMEFTNVLLTARHKQQRAFVSVNGRPIGELDFHVNGANASRDLEFPGSLIRNGGVTSIRFDLPDAAAPNDLGINTDSRLLALYLHRLAIVPAKQYPVRDY